MRKVPIRHLATLTNSNVDKLTVADEVPVRLCNYVDVYKNDHITNDMQFMPATATRAEIAKFGLQVDDVIITKDSEDRSDIAVPALVQETAPDLVCGYHLALLRARPEMVRGAFLFWSLQSKQACEGFSNAAGGVTRFGLTLGGMKSISLPVPDLDTQKAIADFLDHETARIDQLIEKKQRLAALLGEKLEDDILRAVTLGIDPDTELVPEGELEWTSHRPRHWNVFRLKHFFRENTQYSSDGHETLFSLRMKEGLVPHNDVSDKEILPSDLINYKKVFSGQIVMNRMRAAIGLFGLADGAGIVSPDYSIFDVHPNAHAAYFLRLFKTEPMMAAFRLLSKGLGTGHSGFMRLNADNFGRIRVAVPQYEEQRRISQYVEGRIEQISHLQIKNDQSIDRLKEYRSALITAAVTGQIDMNATSDRVTARATLHENKTASVAKSVPPNTDPSQVRRLVAAEIIHDHRNVAYLGRIKVHKIMFLAEAHANITEISGCYRRQAAGPYDGAMIDDVEAGLRQDRFYDAAEDPNSHHGRIVFTPLDKAGGHKPKLEAVLGDRLAELRRIIGLVQEFSTENTEAIATLYAVWNDALIDGEQPDGNRIIRGFREEWHEAKQRFTEENLSIWLDWMRRNDLVPHGSGPHTIPAHQPSLF